MSIFLIALAVYFLQITKTHSSCGVSLVSTETSYNCNGPQFSLATFSQTPPGGKEIYVQAELKFEGLCSGASSYYFVALTIEPTSTSRVELITVMWDGSSNFIYYSLDSGGVADVYIDTADDVQHIGEWFSFTAGVNLGAQKASAAFTYAGSGSGTSTNPPAYDVSWTVDMAPRIFMCSYIGGFFASKCSIANLKIFYQAPSNFIEIRDGITPVLMSQYRLNQYDGFKVTDFAANQLSSAYFGMSTSSMEDPISANKPSWVPEVEKGSNKLMEYSGIVFDQTTKYLTLPTFPIAKSLMTPAYSMTIKIWVKLLSNPNIPTYLFRYYRATPLSDIFALQIETDRSVTAISYNTVATTSLVLSATDWNSVVATFTSLDYANNPAGPNFYTYIKMLINNSPQISTSLQPNVRYVYDPTNIVRLGGPPTVLGIISGVEIYSPGSNFMAAGTTCQATSCLRDLGVTSPNTCILPICATNCAVCFNTQEDGCLACNSGYYLYQSKCVLYPCVPGKYFDSTTTICISDERSCNNPFHFYYPVEKYCRSSCNYPFKVIDGSPLQNCVLDISQEDAKQAENVAQASTITNYATNVGGVIIGLLSSNSFGLLLMESMAEMISYIQYLKIDYPPKVYLMLYEQDVNSGGLNIITEIPQEVEEAIPNHPLPEEFAKNDTRSSFVANTWELLISLCSILLSIGLILIFNPCFKRFTRIHSLLSKLLSSLRWNLFFGIFCSGYGFTAIFTALEFRTVNMDSALSILSFVISLIINTLGFFAMYLVIQISLTFRTIRKTVRNPEEKTKRIEEAEENWKNYAALFDDYKRDHMSQQMFLFIFMLRTYLHYSILGYLNDYPFVQTCSFTMVSVVIVLYLIIRRPMKSIISFMQQMICEVAILVVNVCVLILASMDKWRIEDDNNTTRVKVGDVIIAANFALSMAGSVFMIIETISQIKEIYLYIKTWLQSSRSLRSRDSILKKGFSKSHKVHIAPSNLNPDFNTENLEISSLDKSNDVSIDQLKPR